MNRVLSVSLMLLFASSSLFGQQDEDLSAVQRSNMEAQFDQLDNDGNGTLSEQELEAFSKETLGRMRDKGLKKGYPVSREEFVAAGIAQMEVGENKDREKDEERRQRKELKMDESAPPESATSSPTGSLRNSTGKSRFAPSLPAEYKARDKNGDGQIGLYEWDRAKYAEFAKLDKNGDGFLTAAELLSKSTTSVIKRGDGSSPGNKPTANQDSIEQDPIDKEARETFARMDADRDGGIAEDEWAKSQRVRPMFENAGINASLPMNAESFVIGYRQAKASDTSRSNNGR
ncbi:MAG: EF-hand domain-containing protein [Planctomycetota bacterium]